jgi:hypothetical protein
MDAGSQPKRWSRAYEMGGRESEFRQFRTECGDRTIPVSLMAVSGGEQCSPDGAAPEAVPVQTICSLPTIARPDTFPVNLAGRGLYVRTLHGESQLFPFTMLLPSLSPLITVTFSTPTRCYTKRRATLDWSTITEVGPAFQKDHIKMVAGEVMRLPAALISRTAAPDLLVR